MDVGNPYTIFATPNGDIYAGDNQHGQVSRWLPNATSSVPAMLIQETCWGLFVDTSGRLYCSLGTLHYIVSMALGDIRKRLKLVAGKNYSGLTPDTFNGPDGIFVDAAFNLYVADCYNNRIQFFSQGELNATTVAGSGASGAIYLNHPACVVLDHDGYLFIADSGHNRVVASGPNGFYCVIGCSGLAGAAADKLNDPEGLSFDSFGNLWVTDNGNSRVQKFTLEDNPHGKHFHLHHNRLRFYISVINYIRKTTLFFSRMPARVFSTCA